MTDREKVETGIFEMLQRNTWKDIDKERHRFQPVLNGVLALLKEKEPVEPEVEVLNEIDRLYRCPKCHKCFFYEKQKYCDQCGQAVKW